MISIEGYNKSRVRVEEIQHCNILKILRVRKSEKVKQKRKRSPTKQTSLLDDNIYDVLARVQVSVSSYEVAETNEVPPRLTGEGILLPLCVR